jgi:plasmid stability protein
MGNITVRNIPDNLHKLLKKRTEISRRSMNSEIIACLEEALLPNKKEVEKFLKKSEQIRNRLSFEIDLEEISEAIDNGRA